MHIVVVAHNIRSTHNIGSIFRTCDGLGIAKLFLTGYSPYPTQPTDSRLPHERTRITSQIHKTALGAELTVAHEYRQDVQTILAQLTQDGYEVVALEQAPNSISIANFLPKRDKVALLLGEEVRGITPDLLTTCDSIIEIPMFGSKESFNVSVAAGIALFVLSQQQSSKV